MSQYFSNSFVQFTQMIFNTGYSFLTGVLYPGTTITPLILLLTGSAIYAGIKLIRRIIVEV